MTTPSSTPPEKSNVPTIDRPYREEDTGPISRDDALQMLVRFCNSHFNNPGDKARISIPADPRRDDDLRLSAYIRRSSARITELEAMRPEWNAVQELTEAVAEHVKKALSSSHVPAKGENGRHGEILTLNLNDEVTVTLTRLGRDLWGKYCLSKGSNRRSKSKSELRTLTTQLWEVAHVFGPSMFNGSDIPLETTFTLRRMVDSSPSLPPSHVLQALSDLVKDMRADRERERLASAASFHDLANKLALTFMGLKELKAFSEAHNDMHDGNVLAHSLCVDIPARIDDMIERLEQPIIEDAKRRIDAERRVIEAAKAYDAHDRLRVAGVSSKLDSDATYWGELRTLRRQLSDAIDALTPQTPETPKSDGGGV